MKRNYFLLLSLIIVIFALLLRFARYSDRWGLAYDQAHDVVIARHAIETAQIPLLGPFSSAGPFQTSGVWYWFIMLGTVWFPSSVITPWVFLTICYVLFVAGMIGLGTVLINKSFGLLTGLISAISTAQIAQSVNLTNQSPLSLVSFFVLVAIVMYGKTKRIHYLFFMGFFATLGASIHLQGASSVALVIVSTFLLGFPTFKGILALGMGFFLPTVPILLYDIGHNFVNIQNMKYYILVDQYNISLEVLNRRWKTFVSIFLPLEWSHIIGGKALLGWILLLGSFFFVPFSVVTSSQKRIIRTLVVGFFVMICIIRYTRTPLFSSYLVSLHPIVLLLSSLFIYSMLKKFKILGFILLSAVVIFSLQKSYEEISYGINNTDRRMKYYLEVIERTYPQEKFSLYTYTRQSITDAMVLSMYLDARDAISQDGRKLAVLSNPPEVTHSGTLVVFDTERTIIDVSSSSSSKLIGLGWKQMNPKDIYDETQYWMEMKEKEERQ